MFHGDRQTDITKVRVVFRNFAKARNERKVSRTGHIVSMKRQIETNKRSEEEAGDFKEKRRYLALEEGAPDHTLWRTNLFGRDYGPVVTQTVSHSVDMTLNLYIPRVIVSFQLTSLLSRLSRVSGSNIGPELRYSE